ncbi:helix-turn-helix domain-containing protein [Carnobacterium maltaromaticum]|uniref:helix-turn-helix domain-containing protein n=1 Tax=Carnobacterium maltaromaticum TaxID=2751 RepID=UPI0010731FD4|nr:helix-turn-helix transcriptional regulator [Carnobacterium maltaromaticum]MDT1944367.1 helix-turn-helix transcriptional regulator [Carnobacterium maltaromaticum]MDT1997911.1 helix-turn-helix transcriptional regulator [Carnobacterium maltaromaticum]TFJ56905.1 transcriptional regulator [Carnobacterium maltaromaticum]
MDIHRLKELRTERKWLQKDVAEKIGVGRTTYAMYEQGKREPDNLTLQKIAELFEVSADYLLGRNNTEKKYYNLNNIEKNDIAIQADKLLEGIETGDSLNFYGEPATEEQKERIRVALRTAMEMNKEEAKKKFTRKDYRN